MGIAASIVSAVLKSVVGDKFGNGLAKDLTGISIDGISEKGIREITDFIDEEKSEIDSILSKENMRSMGISEEKTGYVAAEIKDLFFGINITDEVFRQCRYDSMNLSNFLWIKYCERKNGYIEYESEIRRSLFAVANVLVKLVKKSENFQSRFLIQISNSVDDVNGQIQKMCDYLEENSDKLSTDNQSVFEILQMISEKNKDKKQTIKNRTQEYADKWNENMFLNNFDEWDEKANVNVKLKDVYINAHLPHFVWGENEKESDNLDVLLSGYIKKSKENRMLLIFGQPGIGKSTLITWITANFARRMEDILVYKFASDLGNVDWQDGRVSGRILEALCLNYDDLKGKTLILDGFDEISVAANRRRSILDSLYDDWIFNKTKDKFSLIVTCRENYVQKFSILKCNYITLQPWDEKQIKSFCNIFQNKTKNGISDETIEKLCEKKEILGIPLILYIVLALNISIEKEGSIVDIYDKIFSLEGGIYDRCIDNKSFADKHRIGDVKKYIHQISREIAIWIFENNADEAYIPNEEYQKICNNIMKEKQTQGNEYIEKDFLIGNYFKLVRHCDGMETENLFFVHRSIYEYFVAETIYSSVENALKEASENSQEEVAGNIVFYLKAGIIDYTIGEYFIHKVMNVYIKLDNKKQDAFYQWWEVMVDNMLKTGMFSYTPQNICQYEHIIGAEITCFLNLIEILRLLLNITEQKYIMEERNNDKLISYIKCCNVANDIINRNRIPDLSRIFLRGRNLMWSDLSKIDLCHADLSEANLENTNLKEAILYNTLFIKTNLCNANLEFSNMYEAQLNNAYLIESCLEGAKLEKADLTGANLKRAILMGTDLTDAKLTGANLEGAILIDAELQGADIRNTNLNGALLEGATFDERQISYLEDKYDLSQTKVFCLKSGRVFSYATYKLSNVTIK